MKTKTTKTSKPSRVNMGQMKADAVQVLRDPVNAWNVWGVLTAWHPDATSDEKRDAITYARTVVVA
jgi:hypothetical protein